MKTDQILDIAELDDLNAKYSSAAGHSIDMSMHDAEKLSLLLARRIKTKVGQPDLLVGLANGALMATAICSETLGVPFHVVRVRHMVSFFYKQ